MKRIRLMVAKRKCGSGESSGVSNPYPYGCRDLAGQYIIGQGQIKAGFQISTHPPVRDRQKCFWVEKIKTLTVCFPWKL